MVEDEESLSGPVARGLQEEGYTVDLAADGAQGLQKALAGSYDVLIIDWRLPGMDGRTLIEHLRMAGQRTPILMLTAMRDIDHRVAGLDAGADDYLTKPFSFEELLARLRALRRRAMDAPAANLQPVHLQVGPLKMDTARREVRLKRQPLTLRMKEYLLLELLMRRTEEVVTRTMIAERVWGSPFEVTDNAIDVTVSGLRQKLAEVQEGRHDQSTVEVETVRGVGYRLAWRSMNPTER